jgi:ribosome recycling factor
MERELIDDGTRRMHGAVEALKTEFNTVRTGRASTALLDRILVDYYGSRTPLKQLASLATPDARLISITVYDKAAVQPTVRALQESDLGLTPNVDGNVVRLNIPALTAERRKELVRLVRNMAEEQRVAIRNIRRDVIGDLKDLKKEGEISEDAERRAEEEVQKLTDRHIDQINELLKGKEEEILEI